MQWILIYLREIICARVSIEKSEINFDLQTLHKSQQKKRSMKVTVNSKIFKEIIGGLVVCMYNEYAPQSARRKKKHSKLAEWQSRKKI